MLSPRFDILAFSYSIVFRFASYVLTFYPRFHLRIHSTGASPGAHQADGIFFRLIENIKSPLYFPVNPRTTGHHIWVIKNRKLGGRLLNSICIFSKKGLRFLRALLRAVRLIVFKSLRGFYNKLLALHYLSIVEMRCCIAHFLPGSASRIIRLLI